MNDMVDEDGEGEEVEISGVWKKAMCSHQTRDSKIKAQRALNVFYTPNPEVVLQKMKTKENNNW